MTLIEELEAIEGEASTDLNEHYPALSALRALLLNRTVIYRPNAINAKLLEALESMVSACGRHDSGMPIDKARAAIALARQQ